SHSRGETSAAILDCLAYGIPTIINAHGSAAELSDHVLIKLPDAFSQAMLRDAIMQLRQNSNLRKSIAERSVQYIRSQHAPVQAAQMYRDVIEEFSNAGSRAEMLCR